MSQSLEKLFNESLVVDTETTALDFKTAEIIQYASGCAMDIMESIASENFEVPCEFYKPETPISPKISSITTITNRMVADCGNFKDTLEDVQAEFDRFPYMIAHNAYYDNGVFLAHNLKPPTNICTMRMSRKLYANDLAIEEHNLAYLRYALDLPIPDHIPAHLADADVLVTTALFGKLVTDAIDRGLLGSTDDLGAEIIDWLNEPVLTTIMPFGKHKGAKLADVPISYWQWALSNFDSLNEKDQAYDKDFAFSVEKAVSEILEKAAN